MPRIDPEHIDIIRRIASLANGLAGEVERHGATDPHTRSAVGAISCLGCVGTYLRRACDLTLGIEPDGRYGGSDADTRERHLAMLRDTLARAEQAADVGRGEST